MTPYNLLTAHTSQRQARDLLRRTSDLLLDLAPDSVRTALPMKLALAQAFVGLGELDYAAQLAVEALPLMEQLKSLRYLPQFVTLHAALQKGVLRADPKVARLGLYLHGHGAL